MKPTRRLTVSRAYPESRALHLLEPMPLLRLKGRWLEAAGFGVGTRVQIVVCTGRLVLEVERPAEPEAR